MLVTLVSG